MFLPPGFDRDIAIEAAALVTQASGEYDKFKHGADWHLQRNYEPPETLSAKPEDLPSHPEPFRFVGRNGTSGME